MSRSTGRPLTLEGTPKFRQDVTENLSTKAQADGTGADLDGLIGLVGDIFSLRAEMSKRIMESFGFYKGLQDRIQRFDRASEERFSRVTQTIAMPLRDPRTGTITNTSIAMRVDVISVQGGRPVTVSQVLLR